MKDKPTSDELREILWRRPLTEAERARAAGQPVLRAELELEARLNHSLAQLPEVKVSSNFTARVLQAIDRDEARPQTAGWRWSWPRWLPRMAVGTAMVAFVAVSWQHYEVNQHRAAIANSLAQVAVASSVPAVEALDNYDAIQRMGQAQHADEALLALMQ